MTEQQAQDYKSAGRPDDAPNGVAKGFIVFAGVMMIMAGGFQTLAGLVAIFEDEFYVATRNYLVKFDATSWGWIHLLIGLMVLFAGFAVMSGKTWGRVVGITLAVLSALSNFAFIPYYPFWALTIVAIDVFIIWALAAHGSDVNG
jgi:hypothetical protein